LRKDDRNPGYCGPHGFAPICRVLHDRQLVNTPDRRLIT
jgi:hypothetical protein